MLGTLTDEQIDSLLSRQVIGRLACHSGGETYIVPVNYVYRNGSIYIHSGPGKKIEMMRKNPGVCFEVDEIKHIFKWQCVVISGLFEELTDMEEKEQAMQALIHKIMPLVRTAEGHPSHGITEKEYDIGTRIDLILYRIKIVKISGRFED